MTTGEVVTRYFCFALSIFGMSKIEAELTPVGELQDLIEVHNQMTGVSQPLEIYYIDDVIPQ